jgi:hypothetical protein
MFSASSTSFVAPVDKIAIEAIRLAFVADRVADSPTGHSIMLKAADQLHFSGVFRIGIPPSFDRTN